MRSDDNPGPSTIGAAIRRFAETQPDHPAVVASGSPSLSYGQLQGLIVAVRGALRAAGLDRTARIAVAMRNGPQAALAIVTVACSAVSIPLNPRQTLAEVEACLAALRPDALLLAKGADSAARRAAERSGITILEAAWPDTGELGFAVSAPETNGPAASNEPDDPDPDAPAFILQTSGTSAEPKLVPVSHRIMMATAEREQATYDLTPSDRCLSLTPIWYAYGLLLPVLTPLLTGGSVAFPTDPLAVDLSEWLTDLMPTWYPAAPPVHLAILDRLEAQDNARPAHALRFALTGGAMLPAQLHTRLQSALDVPLLDRYGTSETQLISTNRPPPAPFKLGTCGIPWPNTVSIIDEEGRHLAPGQLGEVLVSGPTVASGYLNAPDLTHERFFDGSFKTGDIGSLDEAGFLTLFGRKDDLINRGGEKISPAEIESALLRHPAVAEAVAFAIPHPRLGEDVAAAVVLRSDFAATSLDLRQYLQQQLAAFKIPRRLVIQSLLPKGQTGKILRRQVAQSLADAAVLETQILRATAVGDAVDGELVSALMEIWERLLKVTSVSLDDDFFEKGGDSLSATEMLAELEVLTGHSIHSSFMLDAPTIRQQARYLSSAGEERERFFTRLNPNGRSVPLLYFPVDINRPAYYATRFAKLLGADQPVWVFHHRSTIGASMYPSIENIAADFLPLILQAKPNGPYRLFGYCIAGFVALEAARLLITAGHKVDMVVMADTPTVSSWKSLQLLLSLIKLAQPFAGSLVTRTIEWVFLRGAAIEKFYNVSWARRWGAAKTLVKRLADIGSRDSKQRRTEPSLARLDEIHLCAMANYAPKPLDVPILYFGIDYGSEALQRISPSLEVIRSPGHHFGIDFEHISQHLISHL